MTDNEKILTKIRMSEACEIFNLKVQKTPVGDYRCEYELRTFDGYDIEGLRILQQHGSDEALKAFINSHMVSVPKVRYITL